MISIGFPLLSFMFPVSLPGGSERIRRGLAGRNAQEEVDDSSVESWNGEVGHLAMDQYLLIPLLVG